MRMWTMVGAAVVLGCATAVASAEDNQGHQPEAGPLRVLETFPDQGFQRLPNAMLEHGAPHALSNVTKDRPGDPGTKGQAGGKNH